MLYGEDKTKPRLVKLSGPLLHSRGDEVMHIFKSLSGQGPGRVVVDLADVPLIDSPGLALLVAGYHLFGSRPQNFRLAVLQKQPQLLLELTGFDHIFQCFATASEALAAEPAAPALPPRSPGYSLPAFNPASMEPAFSR
jgi:anti-anti-sigma factor